MKRIIALMLILCFMCVGLTGCGNMAILDPGTFTFNHVHIDTYHSPMCFNIEKWWDNTTGIEVETKEFGMMYLSEGNYILIEDEHNCPYCHGGII